MSLRCWHFLLHAAIGFFAVVNIRSAPSVTTDVGVPFDVGVPELTGYPFFSIRVVWHSAVDTGGKFASGINSISGQ